ncbi:hypothetical protein M758_11G082200 [Ceratodon purpureus]|nr:hypothetical protein M758_11G082200 [Ceratodon purpureus]
MEPPVASSGPMLRRAATFSHRTERALKDVNGRVGLVNKSQEHVLASKSTVDAQKSARPTKQYSAVASRYAAPTIASKKAVEGAHGSHANVTKLPFSTGRSAPLHQRRPSSDNVNSFQPSMVFAASSRDAKPAMLAKKAEANVNSFGAKRPRVGVRASMIDKKSPAQTRAPRFLSLDKGVCTCSKNGLMRNSMESGSTSLLYSASHWLSLIKLAEGEKKHDVVVDLYRLAIALKAEPRVDVVVQLKRYQESCPADKAVSELIEQCEGTQLVMLSSSTEVVDKAVCESGDLKKAASSPVNDMSAVASVSKITIVPPVVSENEAVLKKDEAPAKKAPHFKGRMLSRSATFSVVDEESQSQHAKAEYGKKLAKTLEFLSTTHLVKSPGTTGEVMDSSPNKSQSPALACVLESEISDDQETPGFKVASKILDLASKIGSKLVAPPASENFSSPVREPGSALAPTLANGSAEKPVDSLSEWLDGDSSETGTPDVQSALAVDSVDLSPNTRGAVKLMDVDSLMQEVVSHILPESISKSPIDANGITPNGRPSTREYHVRRKSWQDAGETVTEIVESISRSHRHSFSAEAIFLSAPGSVEQKVKMFTGLTEVKVTSPGREEPSAPASASTEPQEAEVELANDLESVERDTSALSSIETLSEVDTQIQAESVVTTEVETNSAVETHVVTESTDVPTEASKAPLATPLRASSKETAKKGDALPPPIPGTPSAATPCEPASVAILKARHRRSSSMGNMTPRGPIDLSGERSPFGDSPSSPSGQSSTKCKRVSRGIKEVTPRMDLPKPSWKSIVEREMKGSKLKDLLAAELPKETSPLAEYVQSQMESQNRDPESGSKEKDTNSTCSPARPVRKMGRSSSMKKPAAKEEQHDGVVEPRSVRKEKKQSLGEQELDSCMNATSTPGSAVRRSARIQKKVHSRKDIAPLSKLFV